MKLVNFKSILSILVWFLTLGACIHIDGFYNPEQSSSIIVMGILCLIIGLHCSCYMPIYRFNFSILDCFAGIIACVLGIHYLKYPCLHSLSNLYLIVLYISIRLINAINFTFFNWNIIITLLILSLYGYLQYFQICSSHSSNFPITGPYHNPAIYAGIMALLLNLLSIIFVNNIHCTKQNKWKTIFIIATFIIALPIFLLTEARAAWSTFLIVVSYVIFQKYHIVFTYFFKKYRKMILFATPIILLLFGISLYLFKPRSADGRLLIWKVSLQMIADKPFTGFGVNGFSTNYMYYQANYLSSKGTQNEKYLAGNTHLAFNEPIRITVEYGIIGLLFYLLFIGLIIMYPSRKNITTQFSRTILLSIIIWGWFAYPYHVFPMMVFATIALACLANQSKKIRTYNLIHLKIKVFLFLIIIVLIYPTVITIHAYNILQSFINQPLTLSHNLDIKIMDKFQPMMKGEIGYWRIYCLMLDKRKQSNLLKNKLNILTAIFPSPKTFIWQGDIHWQLEEYKKAEIAYNMAHNMIPIMQIPRGRLAFLYYDIGREEEAVQLANELLTEKVKVYGFETHELHLKLKATFEGKLNKCITKKSEIYEKK